MNRKIMVFVVGLLALGRWSSGCWGPARRGWLAARGRRCRRSRSAATCRPRRRRSRRRPSGHSDRAAIPRPQASNCSRQIHPRSRATVRTSSMMRVFVRDYQGEPVLDGTHVHFAVFNGSPSPYFAQTFGGAASTSVVIYSDAYSLQPNVQVRVGRSGDGDPRTLHPELRGWALSARDRHRRRTA